MKKSAFLVAFLLFATSIQANPAFTIGSNPYLTVFAYPHDILKWAKNGLFLTYHPITLPWQGDVTDIFNRPSESYVSNFQEVIFPAPYDYQGNPADIYSWMNVSAYAKQTTYSFGGVLSTGFGTFYLELGRENMDLDLTAEGVGRAREEIGGSTTFPLIPFDAATQAGRNYSKIEFIYANMLFGNPFGLKMRYVQKSSESPTGYVSFTKEGTAYATPHLTWGWSTSACNHIFGYEHANADAWYQNSYILYEGYQLDLQMSYEHGGNVKSGIRYRRKREDGDLFNWRYDDGSDILGDYHANDFWKHHDMGDLIRGYSKVRFWEIGNMDLGLLFFMEYASNPKRQINKITQSDPAFEMRDKAYAVEVNPFFNYTFPRGYVDFGVLLEYSRAGLKNVSPRWNPMSESVQQDVLWDTEPYHGWSQPWESFSEGCESFFATGFESYSSIEVVKNISLLLQLTVLKKYTTIFKAYGLSEISQGEREFSFDRTHERETHKIETWMSGSVGFFTRMGPIALFGTLSFPLSYLVRQNTELLDMDSQIFSHTIRNTWQVQQPTTFRIMMIYSLGGRPEVTSRG